VLKKLVFLPSEEKQDKIVSGVKSYYKKVKTLRAEAAEVL